MNIPNPHLKSRVPSPPPLKQGDHLTRAEFERRYEAMPEVKKAELIEGVVYMPSPVRWGQHASPHAHVLCWLGTYEANTPGVQSADNGTVRLDDDNEPQPDAALIIKPSHRGQVQVSDDDYVVGAPELVVEVAASSVSIDLHDKRQAYARNGVREYIVWRTQEEAIDWFVLRGSQYQAQALDAAGRYRSEQFPGLWLDAGALLRGDLATVLRVLQEGIGSPEHATFVTALQQAAAK